MNFQKWVENQIIPKVTEMNGKKSHYYKVGCLVKMIQHVVQGKITAIFIKFEFCSTS